MSATGLTRRGIGRALEPPQIPTNTCPVRDRLLMRLACAWTLGRGGPGRTRDGACARGLLLRSSSGQRLRHRRRFEGCASGASRQHALFPRPGGSAVLFWAPSGRQHACTRPIGPRSQRRPHRGQRGITQPPLKPRFTTNDVYRALIAALSTASAALRVSAVPVAHNRLRRRTTIMKTCPST